MVDTKRSSLAEGNRGPGLTADAAALVRAETLRTLAKFGIAVLLANGGILWGIYTGVESNLTERFESSLAERIDDAISAKQVVVDQLQRQVLDNVILAATETGAAIGRAEELRNSIAAFSNLSADEIQSIGLVLSQNADKLRDIAGLQGMLDEVKEAKTDIERSTNQAVGSIAAKINVLDQKMKRIQSTELTVSGVRLSVQGLVPINVPRNTTTDDWNIVVFPLSIGETMAFDAEGRRIDDPPREIDSMAAYKPNEPKNHWPNKVGLWAYPSDDRCNWIVEGHQHMQNNTSRDDYPIDFGYVLVRRSLDTDEGRESNCVS